MKQHMKRRTTPKTPNLGLDGKDGMVAKPQHAANALAMLALAPKNNIYRTMRQNNDQCLPH